jgi:Holliday junction resolvasome RuvABC endonuclease subunit
MSRAILGLDLSLTSTGWSVEGSHGAIRVSSKGDERLKDVRDEVLSIIDKHNDPGVVIEGYSFASRNSQSHAIGELGGVIRLALYEREIPYVVVPPTVRAKFATGRGNAGKNEVISAVSARTGIIWAGSGSDDMCDAFILEEMGNVALGRGRFAWPENQKSSLDKIDWKPLEVYCAP